jgi:hypothetical protein
MRAISASTLGCSSLPVAAVAPVTTRMAANSTPGIGLVDTQLRLHRRGRQADLVADDPASPRKRVLGEQALYRIGRSDVGLTQDVAHRVTLLRLGGGCDQPVRGRAQTTRGKGHEVWS